jgi:hypothetical protein
VGTQKTKLVVDLTGNCGVVDGRVMGTVRQKTDQGKNDEEKEKQPYDFFAHSYTSRMNGRITGRRFMVKEKYFLSAL